MVILRLQILSSKNNCPINGKIHEFVTERSKISDLLEKSFFWPILQTGGFSL